MPRSRYKYLYERLGPEDFQLLVNAVMQHAFPGYRPLPLGQADGGRDGVRKDAAGDTVVFQVKWSSAGHEKKAVAWLDEVVRGEEANLRRLASEGVRRYVLVTNIGSTGAPGTGTFDRLEQKFVAHAAAFGFEEMTCLWREQLDAFLDTMPHEVKWQYAEMLAGWELIRYLVSEQVGAAKDGGLRDMIRRVAAAQWTDDERLKFSQAEGVDRERVADLFIDVTAVRLRSIPLITLDGAGRPSRRPSPARPPVAPSAHQVGGAAAYLLKPKGGDGDPFMPLQESATLVRGAPGQGKSTLSQYLSQVHRATFMPASKVPGDLPVPEQPRFPLRVDLSEYVRWIQGFDVFNESDTDEPTKRPKMRRGVDSGLERFIADLMTVASGTPVTAAHVQAIFARVPSIVVLDGLDEAGSPRMRSRVVDAVNKFSWRGLTYADPVQVIVTTRPSPGTNELPEPDPELFEVIALNEMTLEQRSDYLRKWCAVRGLHAREGRELRKSVKAKSAEPYIGELASNPMQLTILVDLIHERGAATPTQRTDLYDAYVARLLAREANKYPDSVRKHQEALKEIMPFLGWYLQSRSEMDSVPGRMAVDKLRAAMRHYQYCYGNKQDIVDELFDAVSDRLWALTSKTEGTFEFEVLSLREYFAAQFLYRYAGEDIRHFDKTLVFRELLRRPQWLNTTRFYGGNARGAGVIELADGILDELAEQPVEASRIASWTLLTDGVFVTRPRQARELLDAMVRDEEGRVVLLNALSRKEIRPLPALPEVQGADEKDASWTRITAQLAADPDGVEARRLVRVLRELLNQPDVFATWWSGQASLAVGTPLERAWLARAAEFEGAAGVALDLEGLALDAPDIAWMFLSTGAIPTAGSDFEARLVRAVLDGECPQVFSIRSMPAQFAAAFRPAAFFTTSTNGFADHDGTGSDRTRSEAIARLRKSAPELARAAAMRKFRKDTRNSTFPWSDTSTALFDQVGRCWLASEIAIIGANSTHVFGGTIRPDTPAFGVLGHPGELLRQTREHASDAGWWREQLQVVTAEDADDLAPAEWVAALWAVASGDTITMLFSDWEQTYTNLSDQRRRVVHRSLRALSGHGRANSPVRAAGSTDEIQTLIEGRMPAPTPSRAAGSYRPQQPLPAPPSLGTVARDQQWFKVDALATY